MVKQSLEFGGQAPLGQSAVVWSLGWSWCAIHPTMPHTCPVQTKCSTQHVGFTPGKRENECGFPYYSRLSVLQSKPERGPEHLCRIKGDKMSHEHNKDLSLVVYSHLARE